MIWILQYEFKAKGIKKKKVTVEISVEGVRVNLRKKKKVCTELFFFDIQCSSTKNSFNFVLFYSYRKTNGWRKISF